MPLLFNHNNVRLLKQAHTPDYPLNRDGTYFMRLPRSHPPRIGFKWALTVAGVNGANTNVALHDAVPTVTRRTGRGPRFSQEAQTLEDGPDGFKLLPLCTAPTVDTIRWGNDDVYELWYLQGLISVRAEQDAPPSAGNHAAWERSLDLLTNGAVEGRAQVQGLGHGKCKTRAVRYAGASERYFGLIEFVGTITPHDAPGRYSFLRWKKSQRIANNSGEDALVSRPMRDTSAAAVQRFDKTSDGQVFDLDGPGAVIHETFAASFEETHTARFSQLLVVGDLDMPADRRMRDDDPRILSDADWKYGAKWHMRSGYDGGKDPSNLIEKIEFNGEFLGEETAEE